MVFDFSQSLTALIYVDGELASYPSYNLVFESMYNNKVLFNSSLPIELTRGVGSSRYTMFRYSIDSRDYPGIDTDDINGYYKAKFYGSGVGGPDILLAEYPAKIKNQFTDNYPQQYQSDNEDNEQYVYYRS